jgi:DNA (cytosine-5)-methyltransferase 1
MIEQNFKSIDLFSGCGGLTEGMKQAGFKVIAAVEIDHYAAETYKNNHKNVNLFEQDITNVNPDDIKKIMGGEPLHLLAGCPPCQGFSSVRRLNKKEPVKDVRNNLIWEYYRFVEALMPLTLMMENVPGLADYKPFQNMVEKLKRLGYSNIKYEKIWIQEYGVPQRRRRLVLVASRIGKIDIPQGNKKFKTVRDCIGNIEPVESTKDLLHKIYPKHTPKVYEKISKIPLDGGSRKDLPVEYQLKCHMKENVGFNDIYGRLKWDSFSSTITGGCLNQSKGRFLHPQENRCITAREAALLQTFPKKYKFPTNIKKIAIALMIGNALPPEFSRIQCNNIYNHLKDNLNG